MGIPEPDGVIPPTCDSVSIGTECDAYEQLRRSLREAMDKCSRASIPQEDFTVLTSRLRQCFHRD